MALIKCKECSKQYSDMRMSCPHCGYIRNTQKHQETARLIFEERRNQDETFNNILLWLIVISVVGTVLFFIIMAGAFSSLVS